MGDYFNVAAVLSGVLPAFLGFAVVAYSIGMIGSAWVSGIARNPDASGKMGIAAILSIALVETMGLFALLVFLLTKFV